METIQGSIYDWPEYYEFVYGSDWQAECEFLCDCFDDFVCGETRRLFEPACGTGRLIYRLGVQGYDVAGLDLNNKAVQFCNERLRDHGLPANAWVGDMCDFNIDRPYDAAFNTINSFRHLTSDQMALNHLKAMAGAIREGGIYVLGFHLTPTEGIADEEESWEVKEDDLHIKTSMWLTHRDLPNRIEDFAIVFDVDTLEKKFRVQDELNFRTYTLQQFRDLLEQVPEFRLAEVFDFAYDQPIELDAETQDAVFVLART